MDHGIPSGIYRICMGESPISEVPGSQKVVTNLGKSLEISQGNIIVLYAFTEPPSGQRMVPLLASTSI